jgi:hypothetical protein
MFIVLNGINLCCDTGEVNIVTIEEFPQKMFSVRLEHLFLLHFH